MPVDEILADRRSGIDQMLLFGSQNEAGRLLLKGAVLPAAAEDILIMGNLHLYRTGKMPQHFLGLLFPRKRLFNIYVRKVRIK